MTIFARLMCFPSIAIALVLLVDILMIYNFNILFSFVTFSCKWFRFLPKVPGHQRIVLCLYIYYFSGVYFLDSEQYIVSFKTMVFHFVYGGFVARPDTQKTAAQPNQCRCLV
jgi:hypothetical protein